MPTLVLTANIASLVTFLVFLQFASSAHHPQSTILSRQASTRLAFQPGLKASGFSRQFLSGENFLFRKQQPLGERRASLGLHNTLYYSTTTTSLFLARGRSERAKTNPRSSTPVGMPRGVKKENLPSKICVTCGRPFTWRKKWEKVWDEVTTCSKSCNHKRRVASRGGRPQTAMGQENDHDHHDDVSWDDNEQNPRSRPKSLKNPDSTNMKVDSELSPDKVGTLLLCSIGVSGDAHEGRDIHSPSDNNNDSLLEVDPVMQHKSERKAAKKAQKADRRAQREGRGDPTAGQKLCHMCSKSVDLLIRCMHEEGQTAWSMVCGKCWKLASGGVVDGDENHPHYRYGGLWKNRRALQRT